VSPNACILVATASPECRTRFGQTLREAGYEVVEAPSGSQALSLAREKLPSLVLLDVTLPEGNGLQVCQQIKADPSLIDVWVILLAETEKGLTSGTAGSLPGRADDCLSGSTSATEFLARMASLLRLQRNTLALRATERQHWLLLELLPDSALVVDMTGRIMSANRQAAILHGLGGPEELLGRNVAEFVIPEHRQRVGRSLSEIARGERPGSSVYELLRQDGSRWEAEVSLEVVKDAQGRPQAVLALGRDVTERKRAEATLRQSERTYRDLIETTGTGYLILDGQGRVVDANAEYVRLTGHRNLPEILGRSVVEWTAPHDRQRNAAEVEKCLQTGEAHNLEIDYTGPDGRTTSVEINAKVVPSGQGRRVLSLCRDITERKRMEEARREEHDTLERRVRERTAELEATNAALRESESRQQALLNATSHPMFLLDAKGTILAANSSLGQALGHPVPEILGRNVFKLLPPALGQAREARVEEVVRSGQPLRFKDQQAGTAFDNHLQPITDQKGEVVEVAVSALDITEAQRAEQALRDSEAKYRRLHESMTDAFVGVDMAGRITEFNPAYQAMLGYTAEELRRLSYLELTPEGWHAFEARIVAEQILPRGYSDVYEKEYRRKDGTVFPAELRTFLLKDHAGRPAGMWAIVRDITTRKEAENILHRSKAELEGLVRERTAALQGVNEALRESEERYRSLVNNLKVGVYRNTPGPHGRFIQANPALAQMHGYDSVEALMKVNVCDLYQNGQDRQVLIAEILRRGSVRNYELRLQHKDGTPIDASVTATAHYGADGQVDWIDGMLEDITERKRDEERLVDALSLNKTMIEVSALGIAAYRASGQCVLANPAMARTLDASREQLLAQDFRRIPGWQETGLLDLAEAALREGGVKEADVHFVTSFGKEVWLDCRLVPFISGGEPHLLTMANDIRERKQAEEALSELPRRVLAAQEAERDRVARDLHDGITQLLSSAKFRLHGVEGTIPRRQKEVHETLVRCRELIAEALEESRRLAHNLRPRTLDDLGLVAACRNLCAEFATHTGIPVRYDIGTLTERLPADLELHLFRIVQEALANVEKHARARQVSVVLAVRNRAVELEIEDNGVGFDRKAPRPEGGGRPGLGLANMRERAGQLGGSCQIVSTPGNGTNISVHLPLHPSRAAEKV
jgi:PAS domain S-box-containing protein